MRIFILILYLFHIRLLDVLADRKASSRISGSIFVDGVERRKDFRFLSGYVVQVRIVRLMQVNKLSHHTYSPAYSRKFSRVAIFADVGF